MPYNDPDATDPMTLHAVAVEGADDDAMLDMAACFVEEFVRGGHSAEAILELFTCGYYAGPSLALRHLGVERFRQLIDEHQRLYGPARILTNEDVCPCRPTGRRVSLTVLPTKEWCNADRL